MDHLDDGVSSSEGVELQMMSGGQVRSDEFDESPQTTQPVAPVPPPVENGNGETTGSNGSSSHTSVKPIDPSPSHVAPIAAVSTAAVESDEAAASAAFEAALAGSSASTNVNALFWLRSYRVLKISIGPISSNKLVWFLILLNFTAQLLSGYVAQSLFYPVGTGTGKTEPGLAGCLKSGKCENSQYEYYLGRFAWTFVLLVFLVCTFAVSGDVINALMRRNLNAYLHRSLLTGHTLYRIQLAQQIDNFDQRITGDAQALLDGLCCAIWGNTSDYLAYPFLFCTSRLAFAFQNVLHPPGNAALDSTESVEIVGVAFAMMIVTMCAYVFPMNLISQLFFLGQKYEGDFRSQHAKVGLNSEQICFYHGETLEGRNADQKYESVYRLQKRYYAVQGGLMFLRLITTISQPSISYMMLSLTGAPDVSYASYFLKQNGDVLEYLLYYPAIMARLAFAAGAAHRVGQLMEGIQQMNAYTAKQAALRAQVLGYVQVQPAEGVDYIELIEIVASPPLPPPLPQPNVTCCSLLSCDADTDRMEEGDGIAAPGRGLKAPLFNNISVKIGRGESLCIMGESGCGKSSLLRVIGGLWPISSGAVVRPKNIGRNGLFFLPQKSYVFPGTLSEQICYPLGAYASPEKENQMNISPSELQSELLVYLEKLDLAHLIEQYGWDTHVDWNGVLSSSERQRLSFIRLFFHKPFFCLADESTSCLDLKSETVALEMCKDMSITLISVAHRPSVIAHHKNILHFDKKTRTWDLIEVDESHTSMDGHGQDASGPEGAHAGEGAPPKIPAPKAKEVEPQGLNGLFVRRLLRICGLISDAPTSPGVLLLFGMFICMAIYGTSIVLTFEYLKADKIVNEIIAGETGEALNISGYYLGINVISSIAQSLSASGGALFGILVQRAIVQNVHKNYFSKNHVLYTLNNGSDKLEGIDGRVVSDANQMREAFSWLFGNPFAYLNFRLGFFPLLVTFLIILSYSFKLAWGLTLFFFGSLFGALIIQIVGGRFTSKSMNRRQQSEGVLRQHYARIRGSIESITFFEGLPSELATAEKLLEDVYQKRMDYALRAALTVIPTISMYYWLSNGNYTMASIIQVYTSNPIDPKAMLNVLAFCAIMGKVGMQLVQSLGGFGMLSAYTHRIADVQERAAQHQYFNNKIASKRVLSDNTVALDHCSIIAGSGDSAHALVSDLTVQCTPGTSILCMGPSACGKSSLHRLLAGLWDIGPDSRAKITRPGTVGHDGIFFVPQSNYTSEGSLCEQIIYPHRFSERTRSDAELEGILAEVGLPYLVGRWTLHARGIEWSEVLSGGEAQRLGFARMLYHEPRFACMDESTSALDLALEADCMSAAKKRGITLLSVATRMTQKRYHQKLLYFDGQGHYTLTDLQPQRASIIVPQYVAPVPESVPKALVHRQSIVAQAYAFTMPSVDEWVDVDDPDINELLVAARGRQATRKTISIRPTPRM